MAASAKQKWRLRRKYMYSRNTKHPFVRTSVGPPVESPSIRFTMPSGPTPSLLQPPPLPAVLALAVLPLRLTALPTSAHSGRVERNDRGTRSTSIPRIQKRTAHTRVHAYAVPPTSHGNAVEGWMEVQACEHEGLMRYCGVKCGSALRTAT